jgi:predicted outer membrane protein
VQTAPPASTQQQPPPSARLPGSTGAPNIRRTPQPAAALNDNQVAGVVQSFYNSRIRLASVALMKGTAPDIRAFATKESGQNSSARDRLQKLSIPPAASNVSAGVDQLNESEISALGQQTGTAFDQAYLAREVDDHKHFLQMLDQVLLPNARDVRLRTHLVLLRPQYDADLRDAMLLQQSPNRSGRATGGSPMPGGTLQRQPQAQPVPAPGPIQQQPQYQKLPPK